MNAHSIVARLSHLLGNHDFPTRLASRIAGSAANSDSVYLRVEATICSSGDQETWAPQRDDSFLLVSVSEIVAVDTSF